MKRILPLIPLTPWFPIRIKPVRVGVYNVSCKDSGQSGKWYAKWDGKGFGWYALSLTSIDGDHCGLPDCTLSWRGLASDPEAA
jgi:hypothetical protein